ncbi:hypothetical protein [Gordonia sp. CPCC 205333]|uniref:hypothetical protein n=1 Tax=Gordonia sp. CPCC 205333 TaxID=3140790 RepID=UPI003AF3809D
MTGPNPYELNKDDQPATNTPGQPHWPADPNVGYQQPGYNNLVPGQPLPVDKRPGAVIGAAIVLIAFGVIAGLLRVVAFAVTTADYGTGAEAAGGAIASIVGLLASLFAIVGGIMLLTSRSKAAAITATVASALLIFTCIGIVATIAVPILLWTQDSAKAWFAQQPQVPPPYLG